MWRVEVLPTFAKRSKKLKKNHAREVQNATDNAETFLSILNAGARVSQIGVKWVHSEPHGVKAFDESGPGAHKMALRLYAYPDEAEQVLYWITMGDKQQQPDDIGECSEFVAELLQRRAAAQVQASETESQRANENENQKGDEERREAGDEKQPASGDEEFQSGGEK